MSGQLFKHHCFIMFLLSQLQISPVRMLVALFVTFWAVVKSRWPPVQKCSDQHREKDIVASTEKRQFTTCCKEIIFIYLLTNLHIIHQCLKLLKHDKTGNYRYQILRLCEWIIIIIQSHSKIYSLQSWSATPGNKPGQCQTPLLPPVHKYEFNLPTRKK